MSEKSAANVALQKLGPVVGVVRLGVLVLALVFVGWAMLGAMDIVRGVAGHVEVAYVSIAAAAVLWASG